VPPPNPAGVPLIHRIGDLLSSSSADPFGAKLLANFHCLAALSIESASLRL